MIILKTKPTVARHIFYATSAQLLGRGSLIAASIILSRSLDLRDFVSYSYFVLTINMIANYATLGIGVAAAKSFSLFDMESEKSREEIKSLILFVSGSIFVIAIVVLIYSIFGDSEPRNIPLFIYGLAISVLIAGVVPGAAINGREEFRVSLFAALTSALVLMLGTAIVHYTGSLKIAATALLFSLFCKSLIEGTVLFKLKILTKVKSFRQNLWLTVPRVFAIVGPMAAVSLVSATLPWIFGKIILLKLGDQSFAAYAIGLQWYSLSLFFPGIITRVLFAKQVRLAATNITYEPGTRLHLLHVGIAGTIVSSIILTSIGFVFGEALIRLYGEEYWAFSKAIPVYMMSAIAFSASNHVGNSLIASNKPVLWLFSTVISFIVGLAASTISLPLGFYAGAFGLGASGASLFILGYILARRQIFVAKSN